MKQNERSDRDRGRALFLVAIVVLSAVAVPAAVAGAAVAEPGETDIEASPATPGDEASTAVTSVVAASSSAELWFRVDAEGEEVATGEEFAVTVEVENVADEACECEIPVELEVDGDVVDADTLEDVEAGATETVELSADTSDLDGQVGWRVTADGQEVDGDWVTVEEPSDPGGDDDDPDDDTDPGDDDTDPDDDGDDDGDIIPGFGIAAALAALIGASLLALRN